MITDNKSTISKSRYGWTIIAFMVAAVLVAGLVSWQLYETSPARWCAIAENTTNTTDACKEILLALIGMKDNALIGLMTILGITVVSLTAIALGLKITAAGPGNTSVNIGADKTTVDTEDASVSIPTPPSGAE